MTDKSILSQALGQVAEGLSEDKIVAQQKDVEDISFYDFVIEIWSKSYDHPEYFENWHIKLISDDIERAIRQQKFYALILPRYHLKSTLMYALCAWGMYKHPGCSNLYASFKEGMSKYHTAQIKEKIETNPVLKRRFKDVSKQSSALVRYRYQGRVAKIYNAGMFSFKRGLHVNGVAVYDDILRDPSNPLSYTDLVKIEDHFFAEGINIPIRGAFLVVAGTPMLPNDLLLKLKNDKRFLYRSLPALNPDEEHDVLMDPPYDRKWLELQAGTTPQLQRAFQSEFMLTPFLSTQSFFDYNGIHAVINPNLKNYSVHSKPSVSTDLVVGGFDIGKRKHPSHLSVLMQQGDKVVQLHQSFLDNMNYNDQVDYLKTAIQTFGIDKLYVDNTRGELGERGLPSQCRMFTFSQRLKSEMAQIFEALVTQKRLEILNDDRFISQILCVDSDLKAPVTPMGHGDSFISMMLGCFAYHEMCESESTKLLMDASEFTSGGAGDIITQGELRCPNCGSGTGLSLNKNGKNATIIDFEDAKCLICGQSFTKEAILSWCVPDESK